MVQRLPTMPFHQSHTRRVLEERKTEHNIVIRSFLRQSPKSPNDFHLETLKFLLSAATNPSITSNSSIKHRSNQKIYEQETEASSLLRNKSNRFKIKTWHTLCQSLILHHTENMNHVIILWVISGNVV